MLLRFDRCAIADALIVTAAETNRGAALGRHPEEHAYGVTKDLSSIAAAPSHTARGVPEIIRALNRIVPRGIHRDGKGTDGGFVFGGVAIGPAGINLFEQDFRLPDRIGQHGAKGRGGILIEKHDARRSNKSSTKSEGRFLRVVHDGRSIASSLFVRHKKIRENPGRHRPTLRNSTAD